MQRKNRIAIVGVGAIFPDAQDIHQFWQNILTGKDSARTPPAGRWPLSMDDVYADKIAPDKVYSKYACFVDDFLAETDGLTIDQDTLAALDPMFHMLLHVGAQAWRDAVTDKLNRDRVGVIIGNVALPTKSSSAISDEILLPVFESQLSTKHKTVSKTALINRYVAGLPGGILAKALQLGGGSYTLDAACASSLYAIKYAIDELQTGRMDAMLCGGLSRPDSLYTQMGFSALHAISASGRCSPFDNKADGLVVGEGAGIIILKRLDDAIANKDHIYATIAGIGLSNDIEGNLMSPNSEGQLRAMRAAYVNADWQANSVGLIECHGTGTPVGDKEEFNSLKKLWADSTNTDQTCVIGSVKSNVGHLLSAAGVAGLIKVLLSFKHKTLPPTANFESASAGIELRNSPFTVLDHAREWQHNSINHPRRAAVSAFGFGGINAHVLLEEWDNDVTQTEPTLANLPETEQAPAIAIVGMDTCFGPCKTLAEFTQRVLGEANELEPVTPENCWGVDLKINLKGYFIDKVDIPLGRFRIPPTELQDMLPQQLLILQTAANAIDDAGLDLDNMSAWLNTGVYIGIGLDLNTTNYHLRWSLLNKARLWNMELELDDIQLQQWTEDLQQASGPPLTANRTMGALGGIVASRIARAFNCGGPSFTLSSEESSGLRALEAGVRALQRGDLNTAIVGAVDLAGDIRASLGQNATRPYAADGAIHPFDKDATGTIVGEGASTLILKRYDDAIRDGDRIYATINGLGSASGGEVADVIPSTASYLQAVQSACDNAGVPFDSISYIETHGSGDVSEDAMESAALTKLFNNTQRNIACAIGSVKADLGHSGAASGIASIAKAALSLYHQTIPPLRGLRTLRPELQKKHSKLYAPTATQYWLRNRAEGPRRALVNSFSVDGNCNSAILEGVEQRQAPIIQLNMTGYSNDEALFSIDANNKLDLLKAINKFTLYVKESPASNIKALASQWWQAKANDKQRLSLNIIASDIQQLNSLLADALNYVEQGQSIASNRLFYSAEPLAEHGKLAFVFPGSGNHYVGMGRELANRYTDILQHLDRENDYLAAQFANAKFWTASPDSVLDHTDVIFGQVWLSTMVSDIVASHGVKPDAIIGYSLGETAGLFATRTWTDRDEMLRRMLQTNLFTEELCGPCNSVKKSWNLPEHEQVDWCLGMINQPADIVRSALIDRSHVYLLIINTPDECVIGGAREAVTGLVQKLGCEFHLIEGVTTVHCEVAEPVEKAYRDLHLFESKPPADVTFYSGIQGKAYNVTRDSAADSIVGQALQSFDYSRVINSAYEDGVRIFIEMGPGNSCSRMIDQILLDRPHVARAICVKGQSETSTLLRVLAQLNTERVSIDLSRLYSTHTDDKDVALADQAMLTVAVGRKAFEVPLPPKNENSITKTQHVKTAQIVAHPGATIQTDPMTQIIEGLAATQTARAETQQQFLKVSNDISETLAYALDVQMSLLQSIPTGMAVDTQALASTLPEPETAVPTVAFNRELCMEFAIGSITRVLGPQFAEIDSYPRRVRLPDEPLMLVDRIIEVQGTPCSMTSGRVVTEHDILPGAWYLDNGRIPTCIAVEAGQADLFLSGYLGIDLQTKGLAVYRLLDAEITFHGPLPQSGKTIQYDIHIDHFFKQGETYLFRFNFEGTVDGKPVLSMHNGCAGFFSQAELDAGQGIVQTELESRPMPGKRPDDWQELAPMQCESYNDTQIEALRAGDLAGCFGEVFNDLGLTNPAGLPGGRMTLVHRVLELDPAGGRYGLGIITGEADIHPDDWFITCHFIDDRVMPGTLMYECCLHTLRIYLLRMGWLAEADEVVYEPVPGVDSKLKCRGQVLETTSKVQYEITLKEIAYTDSDGTPYVLADALMSADGRPIVQMSNMSLRLSGLSRARVESFWQAQNKRVVTDASFIKPAIFDYASILAFSDGKPSEAFGDRYKVFDNERVIARLPRPPFQFLDRIVSIDGCEPWKMAAGGIIEAQYDVPADAWYFQEDRQQQMPYSILLEIALQPCGWLAAYVGSALTSDTDISFRNLGGSALQSLSVSPDIGTLAIQVKMTNASLSGGMIIQHYDFQVRCKKGLVYQGNTYFGFFSKEALSNQIGLREVTPYTPTAAETSRALHFDYPVNAPYPREMMRMLDEIELFDPKGGPNGLGFIQGISRVDPDDWFYKAHFYQDPVWPGSLGLESFMQLLKVIACHHWGDDIKQTGLCFESMVRGQKHSWVYRGQIVPSDGLVTVQAVIVELDLQRKLLRAEGYLTVDGRIIYQMNDFTLRITG